MEIKVSVKDIPEVIEQLQKAEEKINNLQSKIDKAIEYIETNKHFEWHTIRNEKGKLDTAKIATDWVSGNKILDILKEDK